ncbi:hypothetical protein FOZ61_010226 [Perkinsus olseni]|uniref:Uncharacterized protein n=1 Tax=Perkinsus olseni TaxID=32597 RepID=A0A7J6KYA8_PEROL|nr:hypothetical protein FOZ61_010226 [Perkinsus olseni]KAF4651884.1 hypothetical protein FOL46_010006 [Perkinsus olseni]
MSSVASASSNGSTEAISEVIGVVVPDPKIHEDILQGLLNFGFGSLRSLSCMSDVAKDTLVSKLILKDPLKGLGDGVVSSYVAGVCEEAKTQLAYAARSSSGVEGATPSLTPAVRSTSRSKDYGASIKAVNSELGPIPDECMPTQRMLEALRGSPWTYVELSRFFVEDSVNGRRDGTILAEKADGTPVIIKAPEKESTSKNMVRQYGAHWTLAYQSLGWAMLIIQHDAQQGERHKGDLSLASIDAHRARILNLAIQFNWFAATAADKAVRRKIEASASLGIARLGDFYFRGDLLSEVILSALAVSSLQVQTRPDAPKRPGPSPKQRGQKGVAGGPRYELKQEAPSGPPLPKQQKSG